MFIFFAVPLMFLSVWIRPIFELLMFIPQSVAGSLVSSESGTKIMLLLVDAVVVKVERFGRLLYNSLFGWLSWRCFSEVCYDVAFCFHIVNASFSVHFHNKLKLNQHTLISIWTLCFIFFNIIHATQSVILRHTREYSAQTLVGCYVISVKYYYLLFWKPWAEHFCHVDTKFQRNNYLYSLKRFLFLTA